MFTPIRALATPASRRWLAQRIPQTALAMILASALISGCSSVATDVRTVSDEAPAPGSTYALQESASQAQDIEAQRHARVVRAELARQGLREAPSTGATYTVSWTVADLGQDVDRRPAFSQGVSRQTTTHTTQATVAGIGVPGTRETHVHRDAASTTQAGSETRVRNQYQASVQFVRNSDGKPVHKIEATTLTSRRDLHEVAPCLLEAAFVGFPNKDGSNQNETVDCG